jgi:hypothetical protein
VRDYIFKLTATNHTYTHPHACTLHDVARDHGFRDTHAIWKELGESVRQAMKSRLLARTV